jgi:hypothetical protein
MFNTKHLIIVVIVTLIHESIAGDFSNQVPDHVFDVGKYLIDNHAPADVYKGIQSGGALSGNSNYLAVGSGGLDTYGHVALFSFNATAGFYNTYEYVRYGAFEYAEALDMAETNNNIVVHKSSNSGEGLVINTLPTVSVKTFAGTAMGCNNNYPCDNVAISKDGTLWAHGWPSNLKGAGSTSQLGFVRAYTCSSSAACTPRSNAWWDGSTSGSYHAMRGKDVTSVHGSSVDIKKDFTGSNYLIISGAPGNTEQDNSAGYPTYDLGGNVGNYKYGGYFQVNTYFSGVARTMQRVWAPDGDTPFAIDNKFGSIVRLTDDGMKAFITAPGVIHNGNTVGAFYVYENVAGGYSGYDSFDYWKGPYYGPVADENFGWTMEISSDGSRVMIGAPLANSGDGKIYVYNLASDTQEYVLQGDFVDSSNGNGGKLGSSIHYDETREMIYSGVPDGLSYLTFNNVGKVNVYNVPVAPTPAPTASPTTAAPTMSPVPVGVTVGTVEVKLINTNPTASQSATTNAIEQVKNTTTGTTFQISTTEKATLPASFYSSNSNKTELEENIKTARGCNNCQVVFSNIPPGTRRMLGRSLQSGDVTVEIVFTLDDTAYEELVNTGNNLDDPQFITDLATAAGVPEQDISVNVVGTEVVLEVTLTAFPDENGNPVTEDTIQDLQDLQTNVDTIAQTVIDEVGDGEIEQQTLDLCGDRDCSGRGTCDTETGICQCTGDWWGINCESTCECYNDGECVNSYCQCIFPHYGLRCDNIANLGPISI